MANTRWLDSTHALSAGAWTDSDEFRVVPSGSTAGASEKRLPSALLTYLQGKSLAFTVAQTIKRDSIGTTSTDGFLLRNTTAAAAGAQQYSPRSVWEGQGWKTTATAASQAVAFMAETRPVQGTSAPTGTWAIAASINGGAYSDVLTVTSAGAIGTASGSASLPSIYWSAVGTGYGLSYDSNSAGLTISTNGISAAVIGSGNANIPTVMVPSTGGFGWSTNTNANSTVIDLALKRDAANTLALRNSTSAQTFRAYNTYTDSSNGEWGTFDFSQTANVLSIGTMKNGTGSTRNVQFVVGGGPALVISSSTITAQATFNIQTAGGSKGFSAGTAVGNMAYQLGGTGANYFGIGPVDTTNSALGYGSVGAGGSMTAVLKWNDSGGVLAVVPTGGIGYGTGAGGTVTQTTSRTTGVTLNKVTGAITLVSAAGLATWQSFTLTNSTIAATDTVLVVQKSGTDLYQIAVTAVAAGSCVISFATTGGVTTEQPVFNFVVIKGVTA